MVIYQDLGQIRYSEAWAYQTEKQKELIAAKTALRDANIPLSEGKFGATGKHYLLFCEHNPVYTLGKSGSIEHLLLNEAELESKEIEFFKINRGGDITYHGPGQITGYPIFDLDYFFNDVHRYVRSIEEVIIRTLADYGLEGMRVKEYTGVWLEGNPKRKICAIGVHLSRWVSLHGFALNVNTDLQMFRNIIPCGINDSDKDVTSLAVELGREIDINDVKMRLCKHFAAVFNYQYA